MTRLFLTTSLLCLAGCATTSFAPPQVRMDREIHANNQQTFFNAVCTPNHANSNPRIKKNVDGALALIDNYILTYRCQRDRAAEGRQFFEVPAFLATAGGAAAAAFGAPAGVAIGTSAGAAALGQGKSYYAPKDKAKVLSDGLRAMLCIHNEAVGIDAPTLEAISQVQRNSGAPKDPPPNNDSSDDDNPLKLAGSSEGDASVSVAYDRQYFNMISTALMSVEQLVAERLGNSGREFDISGVLAELEKLKQEVKDKEDAANPSGDPKDAAAPVTNASPPEAPAGTQPAGFTAMRTQRFSAAVRAVNSFGAEQVGQTVIQLKTLKPKLDQCVVQAKV